MKYWNGDNEWKAKKAGFNVTAYENACHDYAQIVHEIAKLYRSFDDSCMNYQLLVDREKHAAHNKVIAAIERNEAELRRLGLAPIFQGKLKNGFVVSRQEAGKFAMEFCGYGADAEFAN